MPLDRPLFPILLRWGSAYISLIEAPAALMEGEDICMADPPASAKATQVCHSDVIGICILLIFQDMRRTCNFLWIEMTANVFSFITLSWLLSRECNLVMQQWELWWWRPAPNVGYVVVSHTNSLGNELSWSLDFNLTTLYLNKKMVTKTFAFPCWFIIQNRASTYLGDLTLILAEKTVHQNCWLRSSRKLIDFPSSLHRPGLE